MRLFSSLLSPPLCEKLSGAKPQQDEKLCSEVPKWVEILCTTVYFNSCNTHENVRRNREDVFCIDCLQAFCCNCLPNHVNHKHLKIRRYVYCEVITRQDLSKFFSCSDIQTYHTNKDRVIFLKQRPQHQSLQYQQNNLRFLHNCIVCNKSLQTSLYCSIACKMSAISRGEHKYEKNQHLTNEKDGLENDMFEYSNNRENLSETISPPKRKRPRKRVPIRSPLF